MPPALPSARPPLRSTFIAELIGTFLLVFFGCGAVHAAVLTGAQSGLWQVAIVWGVGLTLAIHAVGAVSGAHLNPAMTLAFAVWGRHPWRETPHYIVAQVAGGFLAAATLFVAFHSQLAAKELEKTVTRGEPGSVVTAMCYGEYHPNPGSFASAPGPFDLSAYESFRAMVPQRVAFGVEVLATAVLALLVFALTDETNRNRPQPTLVPACIGLTVAALISLFAPLTQACFNPARDFGPRLFASLAGWGSVALPGLADLSWLTVYIVAPCLGAVIGAGVYQKILRPTMLPNESNV